VETQRVSQPSDAVARSVRPWIFYCRAGLAQTLSDTKHTMQRDGRGLCGRAVLLFRQPAVAVPKFIDVPSRILLKDLFHSITGQHND